MNKNIAKIFLFIFLFSFNLNGQAIVPLVINSGGGYTNKAFSLEYNIGESSSVQYFSSSRYNINSGYIQSFAPLITGIISKIYDEGDGFILYPNPVVNFVNLKGAFSKSGFFHFQLIDMQGNVLETYPSTYYIDYLHKEFNVQNLPLGTYFIRLIYSNSEGLNATSTFKFIKL